MVANNFTLVGEEDGSVTIEFVNQSQMVIDALQECLQFPHLCDCSIQVRQQVFYAHKAVLLASSKFLRKYFFGQTSSSHELTSPLCLSSLTSTSSFETFIKFAYYSKLHLSFDNVESMLALSQHLDTPSIREACGHFLKMKLTGDNCMTVMTIAENYNIKEVVRQANRLMCKRLIELSHTYQKRNPNVTYSDTDAGDLTELQEGFSEGDGRDDGDDSDNSTLHDVPEPVQSQNKRNILPSSAQPGRLLQVETKAALKKVITLRPKRDRKTKSSVPVAKNSSTKNERGKKLKTAQRTTGKKTEKVQYKCNLCSKSFVKHLLLQRHKKDDHKKCRICRKLFVGASQLEAHSIIHKHRKLKKEDKHLYVCTYCGKNCFYSSALKIHIRTHTGEKPFSCDQCDARFIQSVNLKRHILSYHKKDHLHECKVCGKKFSVLIYLKSHEITHSKDRPFQCETCGAMFKRKNDLRSHYRVHSDEKPFECELCLSKFKTIGDIKTHMKIHNDTKPYVCKQCGLGFKRTGHLNRHLKIHTNEKPFECEECSASFNRKENLLNHKRKHTGEYPYKCEVCGVNYRHLSSLKNHVKKHWENVDENQQVLFLETSQLPQQDFLQPLASLFTTSATLPSCVTLQGALQQSLTSIGTQEQQPQFLTSQSSMPTNNFVQLQSLMSTANNSTMPGQTVMSTVDGNGLQGMTVIPGMQMTAANQQVIFTAVPTHNLGTKKTVAPGAAELPMQAVALNDGVKYVICSK